MSTSEQLDDRGSEAAEKRRDTGTPGDTDELVRDWQLLFCAFLAFGVGRLAWMYLSRPQNPAFNLGIACGFLFCGILGFLMRYVLSPRLKRD